MNQDRKLNFGKYKGQEVKFIILTHIGYIMWCFENLKWFKLNDEEQALYDAVAILMKKDKHILQLPFQIELMLKYVQDGVALRDLRTPFFHNGGFISVQKNDMNNPIVQSVMKYSVGTSMKNCNGLPISYLYSLNHSMNKEVERALFNGENDNDIFGGWCSMNDY